MVQSVSDKWFSIEKDHISLKGFDWNLYSFVFEPRSFGLTLYTEIPSTVLDGVCVGGGGVIWSLSCFGSSKAWPTQNVSLY